MAESVNLTNPATRPAETEDSLVVSRVDYDWDGSRITVILRGAFGKRQFVYEGDEARTLMRAINKANCNPQAGGKTQNTRILEKVVADQNLEGSVNATPD